MKTRIGFFDFTGCEGCQLTVMNLENELMKVLQLVEVVEFRELMSEEAAQLDIAFIEGSISRQADHDRLQSIRLRSRTLVALGACAINGGVNLLAGDTAVADLRHSVYASDAPQLITHRPLPLHQLVSVDFSIPGCPIDGREFLAVLQALLLKREPDLPQFAVCVECKLAEYPCSFDYGEICLGPVTRAGCQAICIGGGDRCRGCRGLVDNPRTTPYHRVLEEHGLTLEDILDQYRTFNIGEES
jgi:coenzyme F420-reducing hydrogenase gamma subunit